MERKAQEIRLPGGETMLAVVTQLTPDGRAGHPEGPHRDGGGDVYDDADGDAGGDTYDEPGQPPLGARPEYEYQDTGALDRLASRVQGLNELVTGVGSAVLQAARDARPDEVNATFGVEFAAKSGRAVAMLADGEARGSISVTLTWRLDGRTPAEPVPPVPPADPPADPPAV